MSEIETLREVVEKLKAYADDWESHLPTFGPVDGTGRYDPRGMLMVDYPRDALVADLRAILPKETK